MDNNNGLTKQDTNGGRVLEYCCQFLIVFTGCAIIPCVRKYSIYENANYLYILTSLFIICILFLMETASEFRTPDHIQKKSIFLAAAIFSSLIGALWIIQILIIYNAFDKINEDFLRFFRGYLFFYLIPSVLLVAIVKWSAKRKRSYL